MANNMPKGKRKMNCKLFLGPYCEKGTASKIKECRKNKYLTTTRNINGH
jgi:hypothetical protein